jgi:hypothetical protein
MKRISPFLAWALFLLGAGIFLLLKNLGVFGAWGDVVWGGIFAAVGLVFVIWFLFDRVRYWRAIAGFTLLGIGAVILLGTRNVSLGNWSSALVLLGVALGFWAVLLSHADNWWAVIPAGVLTVVGLLVGLGADLSEAVWLAAFFVGLGLVFLLLYLVRFGQYDTRWAGIPAAALLLVGLVTWVGAIGGTAVVKQWWPAVLVVVGIVLLILFLVTRRPSGLLPASPVQEQAPSLPVTQPPAVQTPAPPKPAVPEAVATEPPAPPAEGQPGDIYDILAQQPPEPPADEGRS